MQTSPTEVIFSSEFFACFLSPAQTSAVAVTMLEAKSYLATITVYNNTNLFTAARIVQTILGAFQQ